MAARPHAGPGRVTEVICWRAAVQNLECHGNGRIAFIEMPNNHFNGRVDDIGGPAAAFGAARLFEPAPEQRDKPGAGREILSRGGTGE